VAGGASADWLDAADSESWLFSSLSGGGDDDVLLGSVAGADGVPFGDHLSGGPGNDLLYGRGGEDRLTGDDGDDWLYGGDHHDVLGGGPGTDHLYGGTGPDKCTVDAIDTVSADCETTVELQLKPA
jgi:Ca2+-binding RTX toxin-like protein